MSRCCIRVSLVGILFVLATMGLESEAGAEWFVDTVETSWPNGQLKEQWTEIPNEFSDDDTAMYREGKYRAWHENGQLAEEADYHHGYPDGWYRCWYSSGQLKEEGLYRNGKDGIWIGWREDGKRSTENNYRASQKHGKQVTYCEGSYPSICTEEYFCFGVQHGLATRLQGDPERRGRVFYFKGEVLVSFLRDGDSDCFFGDSGEHYNAEHDLWIEWDTGWENFWVGHKVNGQKVGEWQSWSPNGVTQIIQYPGPETSDKKLGE